MRILIILFSIYSLLSPLFSQSFAELAEKEKERREKLKGEKVEVVTNNTLRNIKRDLSISGREETEEAISETKEPEVDMKEREDYWRAYKAELEQKYRSAMEKVTKLENEISELYMDFYSFRPTSFRYGQVFYERGFFQNKIDELQVKLEIAKKEAEDLRIELESLPEKVRKEGGYPGWVR
jgi:membrane protein implicated in regulation of membrane protease activity